MSTVPTTAPGKLPAGGTGDPTRGLSVVVDKIVSAILDTDGVQAATLDQHGQPYRGSGVIVALPEFGASIPASVWRGLERSQVEWLVGCWVRGRAPEVIGSFLRPRYYGVWASDSGDVYVDVVEAWPGDRELDAIRAGRERNQISVWHAGKGVEVQCGGTGEAPEHAPFRS